MTREQRQTLERYFHIYSEQLVQHAYRQTGDLHLAQDLVQKTFVQACRHADTVCAHPNPRAWLFTVLGNFTANEMREAYRRREIPAGDVQQEGYEQSFFTMRDYIPKEIDGRDLELFLLHYEHGLTYREIAEQKGVRETACRMRVFRLRAKCRGKLEKEK